MFFAAFLAPALLIVLFNVIVFIMVLWVLSRRPFGTRRFVSGKEHRESIRTRKEVFGIISITALLGEFFTQTDCSQESGAHAVTSRRPKTTQIITEAEEGHEKYFYFLKSYYLKAATYCLTAATYCLAAAT